MSNSNAFGPPLIPTYTSYSRYTEYSPTDGLRTSIMKLAMDTFGMYCEKSSLSSTLFDAEQVQIQTNLVEVKDKRFLTCKTDRFEHSDGMMTCPVELTKLPEPVLRLVLIDVLGFNNHLSTSDALDMYLLQCVEAGYTDGPSTNVALRIPMVNSEVAEQMELYSEHGIDNGYCSEDSDESLQNFIEATSNKDKPFLMDGIENETYKSDDYSGTGKHVAEYYRDRCTDTLAGWTYTVHTGSICLTPPECWKETPTEINVSWYKRPLYYSQVHDGYFMSKSEVFLKKVQSLGALYDPNYA